MSKYNPKELSVLLTGSLAQNDIYLEALDVVRKNSSGKIWLIGSGVYKTLLNLLYHDNFSVKDWDFIVEAVKPLLVINKDWIVGETKHGNPKFKKPSRRDRKISKL